MIGALNLSGKKHATWCPWLWETRHWVGGNAGDSRCGVVFGIEGGRESVWVCGSFRDPTSGLSLTGPRTPIVQQQESILSFISLLSRSGFAGVQMCTTCVLARVMIFGQHLWCACVCMLAVDIKCWGRRPSVLMPLSVSLSLSLCLCLSTCVSICLSLSLSLSRSLSHLSLSLSLISLSLSLYHWFCLSVSFSHPLFVFLAWSGLRLWVPLLVLMFSYILAPSTWYLSVFPPLSAEHSPHCTCLADLEVAAMLGHRLMCQNRPCWIALTFTWMEESDARGKRKTTDSNRERNWPRQRHGNGREI